MENNTLEEKVKKEELRRKAIELNLCPECGCELKFIEEKTHRGFETRTTGFFIKKTIKVDLGYDRNDFKICSKNIEHYKKLNYEDYDDGFDDYGW